MLEIKGQQIDVVNQGYLLDPKEWNLEIAGTLAGIRKPLKLIPDL